MQQIKHIIWDWNGTILDDSQLSVEIINNMLIKRNIPIMTKDEYSDIFDFPVKNFYKKIGFEFHKDSFESLSQEFLSTYEKRKYECKLRSYFIELQPIIKTNNIKQSILSAHPDEYLKEILFHFNILDLFTHISGLKHILADSKIENGKKLIKEINISKENCLFIGDTIHDLAAAEAMGIEYYLLPSGHNSEQRLKNRTNKIINDFNDIYQRLTI